MTSVLPHLALKETNPGAQFFSGVIRVTKEDYERVVAVGEGAVPLPKPTERVARREAAVARPAARKPALRTPSGIADEMTTSDDGAGASAPSRAGGRARETDDIGIQNDAGAPQRARREPEHQADGERAVRARFRDAQLRRSTHPHGVGRSR
jgi:hypothetical protein